MSVRFALDVVDRMSGPLRQISGELADVDKQLKAIDKASKLDRLNKATGAEKHKLSLEMQRDAMLEKKTSLNKVKADRDSQLASLKAFSEARNQKAAQRSAELAETLAFAGKVAGAYALVGTAVLGAAAAGAKQLLAAQRFRDSMGAALKFQLGGAQQARGAMSDVLRIANLLGTDAEAATEKFRELNSAGFDDRESKILMQFAADLKAVNRGQDVATAAIVEPIKALKRGESLSVDSFKGLEAAGVSRAELNKRLAKSLGVNVAGLREEQATQKVNQALAKVPRGQQAINKLFQLTLKAMDRTALGQEAQDYQLNTADGLIDTIGNRWNNLLKMVNTEGPGSGLVKMLQKVAAALDPTTEEGKALLATLDRIAEVAGEAFDKFDPDALIEGFYAVVDAVDSIVDSVEELGSGFTSGFGKAEAKLGPLSAALREATGNSDGFSVSMRAIGQAAGEVVSGVMFAVNAFLFLRDTFNKLTDTEQVGKDIVGGVVKGITAAKAWLTATLTDLANLMPAALRKALDMHSPSRVMMRLGVHTAEGFAQGVESGAPRVESSAQDMATAAVRSSVPAAQGGGGQHTAIFQEGAVQIVMPAAGASPEEMLRLVKEALAQALREIGFETGAAT